MSSDKAVMCEKHPGLSVTSACSRCGRKICRECIQEFGYFCGSECRDQARASITPEEREQALQAEQELHDISRKAGRIALAAVLLLLLSTGLWFWFTILKAPGKPAWIWIPPADAASGNIQILSSNDRSLTVLTAENLYRIEPKNGQVLASVSLNVPIPGRFLTIYEKDTVFAAIATNGMFRADFAAAGIENHEFKRHAAHAVFNADGNLAVCLQPGYLEYPAGYQEKINELQKGMNIDYEDERAWARFAAAQVRLLNEMGGTKEIPGQLAAFNAETGSGLWSRPVETGFQAENLLKAGTKGFLLVEREQRKIKQVPDLKNINRGLNRLTMFDFHTGKPVWRLPFPDGITWGPQCAGDRIGLQTGTEFMVFDFNGNEIWRSTAPAAAAFSRPRHIMTEKLVFLQHDGGAHCFELADGKHHWSCKLVFNEDFLVADGSTLLAMASPGKGGGGTNPLTPGLEDAQSILQEIGGGSNIALGGLMQRPLLVALELATGEVRWKRENVTDTLFGNQSLLAGVPTAGGFSPLQMFCAEDDPDSEKAEQPVTVIRQFSLKNGKTLYSRQPKIWFMPHVLAGGRLVGLAGDKDGSQTLLGIRMKQ